LIIRSSIVWGDFDADLLLDNGVNESFENYWGCGVFESIELVGDSAHYGIIFYFFVEALEGKVKVEKKFDRFPQLLLINVVYLNI
jgi:hypothetical protein